MPRTRVAELFENYIAWLLKVRSVCMNFARDEEQDGWYTTMLNHKQEFRPSLMRFGATIFPYQIPAITTAQSLAMFSTF